MGIADYFPVWSQLGQEQQALLQTSAVNRYVPQGTLLHNGSEDCLGLIIVRSGQLRSYILSDEGREITLYRLFERDSCLLAASCVLPDIQFDVMIEAEKPSEIWIIPPETYQKLTSASLAMANYSNQLMASRFSETMWLIEQVLWKRFDQRLADFLLTESVLEQSDHLKTTHEKIANHLGTAREVVTRMLRYFQSEGLVTLQRGGIHINDRERLQDLSV